MINKVKLIGCAVLAVAVLWSALFIYSRIKGVPVLALFQREDKMEQTATILRNVSDIHRWVFLTVEVEEVVKREHFFGDVAKIYPSSYELGIALDDSLNWVDIRETDGMKIASLRLPPIKIVNSGGFDVTKVVNVYGDASDKEQEDLRKEAERKLRARATSDNNLKLAKQNAEEHFKSLFKTLGCDSVKIEWQN